MAKKELINAVCNRAEINRTEFEHGFNNLIEVVKETIAKGEPIYVRGLGLVDRKSNDRVKAEIITDKLRDLNVDDPCKYDFALFGVGESQKHVKL